jgi:putative membrane protein
METSWLILVTDWDVPVGVTCALVAVGVVYMRGWLALRCTRAATVPVWRLASFLAGLLALFVAVSSPLDTFSETFSSCIWLSTSC